MRYIILILEYVIGNKYWCNVFLNWLLVSLWGLKFAVICSIIWFLMGKV